MDILLKYFPELTDIQRSQFSNMIKLYHEWNVKINVVSRKDIDFIAERHILHALSIVKHTRFKKYSKILDIGTGGGFPGLPLAVYYPNCNFHLVDSIGKKIKVVKEISNALQLENINAEQNRVEQLNGKYKYIVSRAVAPSAKLLFWTKHLVEKDKTQYLLLKGGDLKAELKEIGFKAKVENISKYFNEPFFEEKKIVFIQK